MFPGSYCPGLDWQQASGSKDALRVKEGNSVEVLGCLFHLELDQPSEEGVCFKQVKITGVLPLSLRLGTELRC